MRNVRFVLVLLTGTRILMWLQTELKKKKTKKQLVVVNKILLVGIYELGWSYNFAQLISTVQSRVHKYSIAENMNMNKPYVIRL